MLDLDIRDFVPTDADACVRIFDQAWHAGHPYAPRAIDEAVFERETRGEDILVAATLAGEVIGFAALYMPERFVHHLYVDPAHARRGVGALLLTAAVTRAGGRASLKCQTRNGDALRFYRRHGWRDGETGGGDSGPWIKLLSP